MPSIHSRPRAIAASYSWLPAGAPRAIHRHHHDRGVVEVGIIGIVVLEGPAAGAHVRPLHRPVALDVQHLPRLQPVEALLGRRQRLLAAGLEQRMTGQRGVPHRRDAGLAIGLVLADHQQPVEPPARDRARRIIRRPCRAPRTSSRRWPSADRSRRGRPRRSAVPRRRRPRARSRARAASSETAARSPATRCPVRGTAGTSPSSDAAPSPSSRSNAAPAGTIRRCRRRWRFFARGFSAASTISGTIVVRAQYEILLR